MSISQNFPDEGPTLSLNFASSKTLDPRITFTRASTGTYTDDNGLVVIAPTGTPRFDHNPATGESLGLLVEEARTNLVLRSEEFDNASWNKIGSGTGSTPTVTANIDTAPNGTQTADQLTIALNGGSTTNDGSYITQSYTSTSGFTFTVSLWIKATSGSPTLFVDLDSQNFNIVTATSSWQRVSFTRTSSTTGSRTVRIGVRGGSGTGDSASILIWGAQLEAGAFPTSYIPTTSATVTRATDVASITGSAFTSFYNQTEGTVLTRARTDARHGGSNSFPRVMSISDGTNSNIMENYYRVLSSYTDAGYRIDSTGVTQVQFDTNNERNGQNMVFEYANNDFSLAVGGTIVNTDVLGTVPTTTILRLGTRGNISSTLNGTISQLSYYPRRLSNTQLQALTK